MDLIIKIYLLSYLCWLCSASCSSQKSCGKCIGHAVERCVWCSKDNVVGNRCQPQNYPLTDHGKDWCDKINIVKSDMSSNPKVNIDFNSTIQLKPQLLVIKARPGDPVKFNMSYHPAEQFPLDVYFLMDYSYSMKKQKEALENQVSEIYKALQKMTKNVLLGVGSFVDKPGFPYADVMLDEGGKSVHYSYAFKNHLSLTNNTISLVNEVKKAKFGGNYDDPEASLDALMQVMACTKEINWRNDSRRIIVLATDNTYHSAGDGKMIGAIKPNTMKCLLEDNEYKSALTYDYPSVSQINKMAKDGKFKIIFAAPTSVQDVYQALSKQIIGANYVEFHGNSSNNTIVELIKTEYSKSVDYVELDYKTDDNFEIEIDCKAPSNKCKITLEQNIFNITGSIKAKECPPKGTPYIYNIDINHIRLKDKLRIEFEVACQCECEKLRNEKLSKECSYMGNMICGTCNCTENRSGDTCELNCSDGKNYQHCYPKVGAAKMCNGHGNCRCGKCVCEPYFSGEFCQYNDKACEIHGGHLCSGHGKCVSEKCDCTMGWTGKGCECPVGDSSCIQAFSKKVCSGRGECKCGKCECQNIKGTDHKYLGTYCDTCDECSQERCKELKDYVYCNFKAEKEVCDEKWFHDNQTQVEVIKINKSEFNSTYMHAFKCQVKFDNGMMLVFKHENINDDKTGDGKLRVIIQNELESPVKASIWVILSSVIGGILLIGILTLIIWKCSIDKYDAREYKKFCDAAKAQDNVTRNVLYEKPHIHFNNPTYEK